MASFLGLGAGAMSASIPARRSGIAAYDTKKGLNFQIKQAEKHLKEEKMKAAYNLKLGYGKEFVGPMLDKAQEPIDVEKEKIKNFTKKLQMLEAQENPRNEKPKDDEEKKGDADDENTLLPAPADEKAGEKKGDGEKLKIVPEAEKSETLEVTGDDGNSTNEDISETLKGDEKKKTKNP